MLWMFLAKDTLYLKDKKPIVLKPVETTVEEENFRHRFSINEFVHPTRVNHSTFGEGVAFYYFIGGITPTFGYSFTIRGMSSSSNRIYINGLPITNMSLTTLSPLPFNEGVISSARVYRGDAPIEYDGFLGGVIDMSVEPVYNKVQVGVPTTYVFYRGFYGQYSNPTYLNVPPITDPRIRGGTENYSAGLVRRFWGNRLKLTVLYGHSWMGIKTKSDKDSMRLYAALNGYGTSLTFNSGPISSILYAYISDNAYDMMGTYGSAGSLRIGVSYRNVGGRITIGGIGVDFEASDNLTKNRKDVASMPYRNFRASLFASHRWDFSRSFLYAGVRLNYSMDTIYSPEFPGYDYGIRGIIPTFRINYKWFVSDVRAFKVFVGSSYQNYAPFFYLPFMDLYPSPYFKKYPYVYTASFGEERLIGDYALEVNLYARLFEPFVFYNWEYLDSIDMSQGLNEADILLSISKASMVASAGVDFTFLDKAKQDLRISGFVGRSLFVRDMRGASPWDIRWSLSVQAGHISILARDGMPVYTWRYKCTKIDERGQCLEKELKFYPNREFFTLLVGWGYRKKWRGWDVKYGLGNIVFLWNRAWPMALYDPTNIYKTTPLFYFHVGREF